MAMQSILSFRPTERRDRTRTAEAKRTACERRAQRTLKYAAPAVGVAR